MALRYTRLYFCAEPPESSRASGSSCNCQTVTQLVERKCVRESTVARPACRISGMRDPLLPGADLIEAGLTDLGTGTETDESLLVSMAAPRLRALGFDVPAPLADAELRLYRRLAARHGDAAHTRYNALVRRLVSFQRAAAC